MRSRGFTLIELLVVIGIMIVLGGMVLAAIDTARKYGERMTAKALVDNLQAALTLYESTWGMYVDDKPGAATADGNFALYKQLSGDLDADGSVAVGDMGSVYHEFSGDEISTLKLAAHESPVIDALGYNIGYDMTYNPLSRKNTFHYQTKLGHSDTGRDPNGRNPRTYDIWSIGPNGLPEPDEPKADDYRNWKVQ